MKISRNGFKEINKRRENTTTRRAFTLPEPTRLVEAADLEWKGMILVGLVHSDSDLDTYYG